MSLLHTTPVGSFCCAADFKRHVGDVEAALARKTDELHQYRHKLEAELSGMCHTHSDTHSHCVILYVPALRYECDLCLSAWTAMRQQDPAWSEQPEHGVW